MIELEAGVAHGVKGHDLSIFAAKHARPLRLRVYFVEFCADDLRLSDIR